jgi:hypothetical protein
MPLDSGDGRGRSPEGRKSRFVGEEPRSPSLQRGEHVTSHGSTSARSIPLSLVARVVRIGSRFVAKPVLRANASVEAARWQLRLADRLIPRPPRGTETIGLALD